MSRVSKAPPLRLGSYVTLPLTGGRGSVAGLVDRVWSEKGRRLLSLYSYRRRRCNLYEIDRRGRVTPLAEDMATAIEETAVSREYRTGTPESEEVNGDLEAPWAGALLAKLLLPIAAVVLLLLVLPLFQAGVIRLSVAFTSYDAFLARDLTPGALLSTVAARVDYRIDLDEYWSAPADVWSSRAGDCEDQALLVAAYLMEHGIPHTILGLSLEERLQGHVVVVADVAGERLLLDPTMATAPGGLERFSGETELAEIVAKYAALPARIYPSDPEPGRPRPVGFVEE